MVLKFIIILSIFMNEDKKKGTSKTPIGEKFVKLMIMSYKAFLRNFREKYSGAIFRNLYNSVPKTIRKIVGQVMRVTKEFPKKFSIISWDKFRNITKNQITKISIPKRLWNWGPILENYARISNESVTRNLSLRNSTEILQSKSPKLVNLRKFNTFVTCDMSGKFYINVIE